MAVLEEIDYETLPLLKDILESQLPKSIMAHGFVDIMIRYDLKELGTKIFFVNESSYFSSFMVVTPASSWEGVQTLSVYYEDKDQSSSDVPDRESAADEELAQLLLSIPNLNWTKTIYFFGCSPNVLNRVRRLMTSRRIGDGYKGHTISYTHVYIFDPKDAPRDIRVADGYTLGSLSPAHNDWVFDHWPYNFTEVRSTICSFVSKLPSVAAFLTEPEKEGGDLPRKSQPVSWILTYKFGGMGNTFTLPEHRRRGLAKGVTLTLARKVAALGSPVFVNVVEGNTASADFHVNLGFRKSVPISWEIYLPCDVSLETLTSRGVRSSKINEEVNIGTNNPFCE